MYLLMCLATTSAAYGLKHRAVRLLPQVSTGDSLSIAIQNADRGGLANLVALAERDPRVSAAIARSHSRGLNFSLMYLVSNDNTGMHFFLDHFAHTSPAESWPGHPTAAYDVEPGIETIPRDQFRSLVIWGLPSSGASSPQVRENLSCDDWWGWTCAVRRWWES